MRWLFFAILFLAVVLTSGCLSARPDPLNVTNGSPVASDAPAPLPSEPFPSAAASAFPTAIAPAPAFEFPSPSSSPNAAPPVLPEPSPTSAPVPLVSATPVVVSQSVAAAGYAFPYAAVMGSPTAPVTIVEFSDYQCPFCRIFATQTMAQIQKDYIDAGKVQFYFVDFPLAFHSMAHVSAQAARCAGKLGTYWRMHDKMFAEQAESGSGTAEYSVDDLKAWARQIGLDGPSFEACLDSGRFADVVDASYDAVLDAGISGTPSFYINGQLLVGAQPYSAFRDAIDAALAG